MTPRRTSRGFRIAMALVLVMGLGLSGLAVGSAAGADRVLLTNWVPEGGAAPVFHALEKGWFKAEGINLRILRGYGSNKTAGDLEAGKTNFAYGDTASIILIRAKGAKSKVVGVYMDKSPVGLAAVPPTPLRTPKDLEGRSLGMSPFSITRQLLPVLAAINGVDVSKIRIITTQPGLGVSQLLSGNFDISDMWEASSKEIAVVKAQEAGKKISFIAYRDFGLDVYSLTFWANEPTLKKDAKNLRGFLKAAYRGFRAARKNPQAAFASLMKHHPALDRKVTRLQIATLLNNLVDWDRWDRKGPGAIDAAKMQITLNTVRKGFKVKKDLKAQDIYTNAFLPGKM